MITELTKEVLLDNGFRVVSFPCYQKNVLIKYLEHLQYTNLTTGNEILLSPLPTQEDIAEAQAEGEEPYYEGTIYYDFGEEYVGSIEGKERLLNAINWVTGNIEKRLVKCETPECLIAEETEGKPFRSFDQKCPYCEKEFTFLD